MSKTPYIEEPKKRRGRPPGTKNPPGHNAGRPSNGNGRKHGAVAPMQGSPPLTGTTPDRPYSPNRPLRVAYDTPAPPSQPPIQSPPQAPAGGNGHGRKPPKPKICNNPLPNLPAKPLSSSNGKILACVAQSGLNPELITPEQLLLEIQAVATSDIRKIPGCPELDDDIAKAISSFTIIETVTTAKDGSTLERKETKFTLWSKTAAQDQLARHHGLYAKDKTPVNAQFAAQFNQININSGWDLSKLSTDEIEAMMLMIDKAGPGISDLEAARLPQDSL